MAPASGSDDGHARPRPRRPAGASPRGLSVRTWVMLATLMAVLPLLAYAAWIVVALVGARHADEDRAFILRARTGALAVKHRLDRATAALEVLAVSPAALSEDYPALYAQAARLMAAHPDAVSISLVRAGGLQVFTTALPWGAPAPPSPAWRFEEAVFAQGHEVYSPLFIGAVTGRSVMGVSVPVQVGGAVKYALRMTLPVEAFSDVIAEQRLPADWTAAVIDPAGIIAGRMSDAARLVGRPATASLRTAIARGDPCPYRTRTYAGVELSTCAARVPGSDWYVAIGVRSDEFDRELRAPLAKLLAGGFASVLLGLAGALLVANVVRQEVKRLASVARHGASPAGGSPIREVAEATEGVLSARDREDELARRLAHARHDSLTGLPGRELFRELVARDVGAGDPQRDRVALLFIDLDGFKAVNDRLGHACGDRILRPVAETLRGVVRDSDVPGRVGGDEFVLYLRGAAHELTAIAESVAQRLVERIGALDQGLGCSVGIALGECRPEVVESLLGEADRLMMQAKAEGKGRYVLRPGR